jgi:hypothetical protein
MITVDFQEIKTGMQNVANFFDSRKVGHVGPLGFRRSTDLSRLLSGLEDLIVKNILRPFEFNFFDLGCGDGRVNILMSYICNKSIGVEIDDWTLEEYSTFKPELADYLSERKSALPSDNIYLYEGDALDTKLHEKIFRETGIAIEECDLFYTYLTMHEEFADLISRKAKPGALFMVYGLERIMPRYDELEILTPYESIEGILALYRKPLAG